MKRQQGLTLMEVMITVVIIGVLSAIAWPMFEGQSLKNRRTMGIRALLNDSNILQGCYTDKGNYLNCGTFPHDSDKGYYTVTLAVTDETYTLTATPKGVQATDTDCTSLTLNHLGVKGSTGSAPKKRCWAE